ncbi:hypothetical protein [Pseudoprimorskyibacter insulae]|uniref:C-type lysozyme inhibitor domain-containing protein n=1 Tax=Pseudoprimorskyibacter insulae TaxID=1695997 RepID=A0A2R8AY19_9RHOB|nr:hypothetical protein [Pseudoprimorskyibacter insulae]SPF80898.1 hypothetical protein PRI8871_02711 [Pseudoprimorskyibacter insulae]
MSKFGHFCLGFALFSGPALAETYQCAFDGASAPMSPSVSVSVDRAARQVSVGGGLVADHGSPSYAFMTNPSESEAVFQWIIPGVAAAGGQDVQYVAQIMRGDGIAELTAFWASREQVVLGRCTETP